MGFFRSHATREPQHRKDFALNPSMEHGHSLILPGEVAKETLGEEGEYMIYLGDSIFINTIGTNKEREERKKEIRKNEKNLENERRFIFFFV